MKLTFDYLECPKCLFDNRCVINFGEGIKSRIKTISCSNCGQQFVEQLNRNDSNEEQLERLAKTKTQTT